MKIILGSPGDMSVGEEPDQITIDWNIRENDKEWQADLVAELCRVFGAFSGNEITGQVVND